MVARWVAVQSTWLKREFIFPEREGVQGRERAFSGERRIQESGEFKRGRIQEGEEKCVMGIYPLLLDTPQWLS